MKEISLICLLLTMCCTSLFSQDIENPNLGFNSVKKGDLSIYFGWNRSVYTNSDIHFQGTDYDFTIENATASDRQTPFAIERYFKIDEITIPQTNMGLTYQLTEKTRLSFNVDHMKYVLDQNQIAPITGRIGSKYGALSGDYDSTPTEITEEVVRFEHTDGLNYVNLGYTRTNHLLSIGSQVGLQFNYGGALGFMLPKTNSILLGKDRYDDFHLAGYGFSGNIEAQLNITKWFFLASNLKGGFINMPDIRTSLDTSDKASQHFWYTQWNFLFGFKYNLQK